MSNLDRIEALRSQGFSFSQIGAQLGITKDAARGVLARGLAGRERAVSAGGAGRPLRTGAEAAADAARDGGVELALLAGEPGRDRPGDLHRELARTPACRLCHYLDTLTPHGRAEWEHELALPEISHAAFAAALRNRDWPIGETSVRRHRMNHVAR